MYMAVEHNSRVFIRILPLGFPPPIYEYQNKKDYQNKEIKGFHLL